MEMKLLLLAPSGCTLLECVQPGVAGAESAASAPLPGTTPSFVSVGKTPFDPVKDAEKILDEVSLGALPETLKVFLGAHLPVCPADVQSEPPLITLGVGEAALGIAIEKVFKVRCVTDAGTLSLLTAARKQLPMILTALAPETIEGGGGAASGAGGAAAGVAAHADARSSSRSTGMLTRGQRTKRRQEGLSADAGSPLLVDGAGEEANIKTPHEQTVGRSDSMDIVQIVPEAAHDRVKRLAELSPQLVRDGAFNKVLDLSDEEFTRGLRMLTLWCLVNGNDVPDDVVHRMLHDFLLVAYYAIDSPTDQLLGDLRTPGLAMSARKAVNEARKRAEQAEAEARKRAEQAEAEARKRAEQAAAEARERAKMQEWQRDLEKAVGRDNVVWSLYQIVSGSDPMDLGIDAVLKMRAKFGWSLSFSQALHEGYKRLLAWFKQAGIDTGAIADQYQCMRQEHNAARLSRVEVEETPIPGVRRVVCTYANSLGSSADTDSAQGTDSVDSHKSVATSLLMYAPVVNYAAGKDRPEFGNNGLYPFETLIPGVMPQLDGQRPVRTGRHTSVYSMPLVLTPPRIHLLLRIADGMAHGSRGVQLTGVHGAGKSTLLRALSTVLPMGHQCDMLHLGEAADLLNDPNACGVQLAQSSGPLVDPTAKGSALPAAIKAAESIKQTMVEGYVLRDVPRIGGTQLQELFEKSAPNMTQMLPITMERIYGAEEEGVYCGRVQIFDEVNQLIKDLRKFTKLKHADKPSQAQILPGALVWRKMTNRFFFRILASSPDGAREKVPIVSEKVFYELRPARFDHLAAILHAAPEYLQPELAHVHPDHLQSLVSLEHAMRACRVLCGNMRTVTHYTAEVSKVLSGRPTQVAAGIATPDTDNILAAVASDYVQELVDRLVQSCKSPDELRAQSSYEGHAHRPRTNANNGPATFYDLAVMNASMGVRQDPTTQRSSYDLLGQTILRAVKQALRNKELVLGSLRQQRLFAQLVMSTSDYFTQNGDIMEDEVQKRLSMQALSPRKWKLSALADIVNLPERALEGDSQADGWRLYELVRAKLLEEQTGSEHLCAEEQQFLAQASFGTRDVWLPGRQGNSAQDVVCVLQSSTNKWTIVDEKIVKIGGKCLKDSGDVLISTAAQFPRADFIFLHAAGKRRSVHFVEVTKSTLKAHGAGSGYEELHDSVKDLARLTHRTFLTAKHTDGRWWIAADPNQASVPAHLRAGWTEMGKQTLANFWLCLLGCPMRAVANIVSGQPKSALQVSLQKVDGAAQDFEWDIQFVYVSGSDEEPKYAEYAGLQCDCAFAVFRADLDAALDEWLIDSETVPPAHAPGAGGAASS